MEIYHPRDDELLREMRRVRRSAKRKRLIWGLVIWLILTVAAGIYLLNTRYRLAVIKGPAMGDTLPEGTLVLVHKPEKGKSYKAGDIILYEKTMYAPVQITILSPKGKIRDYCQYRLYRDLGTTRQYMTRQDGRVTWVAELSNADIFESDPSGVLELDTKGLPNGEYWLKETRASWGQDVLEEPIQVTVNNPVRTQIKRVLAASGDRLMLSPFEETRVNSQPIDHSRTYGRTADAVTETRRINRVSVGQYYVQGDHLSLSTDSRDPEFDVVEEDEVLGRAEFALWPLRSFGSLTGQSVTVSGGGQGGAE